MTRLLCKPGTVFGGFSRALLRVLDVLDQAVALGIAGVPAAVTLTAGSNGGHAAGSAHYRFEAVDVRTKDFASTEAKHAFADIVRVQLGDGFFVDLEDEGADNEHLHVQLRRNTRFDLPVGISGRASPLEV